MTETTHTPVFSLPELFGRDNMAALLGFSQSHLTVLSRRGELPPSFKIGKRRYWRRADVLAWLDQRSVTPSPAAAAPTEVQA